MMVRCGWGGGGGFYSGWMRRGRGEGVREGGCEAEDQEDGDGETAVYCWRC